MEDYRTQAANGKRWCYDCKHYRTSHFCGYDQSICDIHGSLDVDQKERHPDKTADTCPDYTPNGKKPWWMKYEEREKENMTMENMVKTLENRGFYVEKTYNRKLRVYEFYIAKDSIGVAGNFEYPKSAHYPLVDRAQRVFIEDLVREWTKAYAEKNKKGEVSMAKHEWTDPETGKKYGYSWGYDIKEKGESNMKDNDNLTYVLAQTSAGHLTLMGTPYPVLVRDVTVDGRCADRPTTLLTLEVCGRYGDPNDKLYPKYRNNSTETIRAAFDTLNMSQRSAVYELVGRAIKGEPRFYGRNRSIEIENVIFNPPATIVFWADNTKTVVKCQEGDYFDPEKGLTMAITKKIFGNKGNYCEEIKKWVKKYQPVYEIPTLHLDISAFRNAKEEILRGFRGAPLIGVDLAKESEGCCPFCKVEDNDKLVDLVNRELEKTEDPEKRWKIWWKKHDVEGKVVGSGVHHTDYDDKTSALIAANSLFANTLKFEYSWEVSQDNPWEEK